LSAERSSADVTGLLSAAAAPEVLASGSALRDAPAAALWRSWRALDAFVAARAGREGTLSAGCDDALVLGYAAPRDEALGGCAGALAALRPVSSDALAHGGACSAATAALALAPAIRIDQSSFMPAGRAR
jgi:hypothetical protein